MPKTIRPTYTTFEDYVADATICPDCGGLIAIRNPSGHCDHLYYPEYKTKSSGASDETTKKYDKETYGT